MLTTGQSCIKFKSSSVHGIELSSQLKFSSFDKNWTWTAAQLTIELFWTEFKVNSERVECPLVEKRRNWAFSMSWHTKFCSSFPFLVGGTPLSLNWLWTQFKKVQWWVEQQFKFSFWSMNWIWIDHQVQGKNWIELRTSIQFWTAIQLWKNLFEDFWTCLYHLFWNSCGGRKSLPFPMDSVWRWSIIDQSNFGWCFWPWSSLVTAGWCTAMPVSINSRSN